MANAANNSLPKYDKPPVIEVVCGMQFAPLGSFQATAFGLLWERLRKDYPVSEQHPPLAHIIERFGQLTIDEPRVEISKMLPLPRMFFVHKAPCWLMQVQNDRFHHNWRKVQDGDTYPHFEKLQDKFWSAWAVFLKFCRDEKLGEPQIDQLEITYINHIIEGEGWDQLGATGKVFPDIAWRSEHSFLPDPEALTWKTSYLLPDQLGRLHVSVRSAFRLDDIKPVLLCELTTRGKPSFLREKEIRSWFQLGREWIVRAFADLTAEEIQQEMWRKTT